ncbi:MAG: TRAP transporter large permease subunit [Oscillospiraceae bacterium]|nr:TRAP transporter large permease subunit [Oscillospiraceae bacterium]
MSTLFLGIPVAMWMLIGLIGVIILFFIGFKRPIYEAMVIGFVFAIIVTGKYDLVWTAFKGAILNTTTLAICTFVLVGYVFEKIGVMNGVLDLTYAATGRLYGGAGWVTILCCAFMGALTGTVMASIAAVGVFTIPAMKKAGYRPEVAAATSISAGCFGPMIPPSTTIIMSAAIYEEIMGAAYSQSTYWSAVWIVAIYYIIQRAINLVLDARKDKIKPIPKEDLPDMKDAFKRGWKALLIPVIIFIPFILNNNATWLIADRLTADGAKAFNSCILLWIPMITTAYCLLIGRKKVTAMFKENKDEVETWGKDLIKQISPLAVTIIFAQAAATIYSKAGVGVAISEWITSLGFSKLVMAIFIVLLFVFLGTVLSGTAMISVVGATACTALIATGVNPLVACAVLPSLAASSGLTPPMAAGMYACMGIAESGFKETAVVMIKYLLSQMVVAILLLVGVLPIFIA